MNIRLAAAKFPEFLQALLRERAVLYTLIKRDFTSRYLGSYLGFLWAFIHPLITTLLLWFIFEVGFRTGGVSGYPFILWLLCGLIPWYFFSDALANATNSISDNAFLVKKVAFRLSLLPVVKIASALIVHGFFLLLLFVLLLNYDFQISIHAIQLIPLTFFTCVLLLGLSLAASAVLIFIKDLGQAIQALLQFGFWLTPIFWSMSIIPDRYHAFIKLNPLYLPILGFRLALLDHRWLTDHPLLLGYFIAVSLVSFFIGATIFMKLRPHFADVI
jgi:ABC-type polysaccharide/polyol phosphate export permease